VRDERTDAARTQSRRLERSPHLPPKLNVTSTSAFALTEAARTCLPVLVVANLHIAETGGGATARKADRRFARRCICGPPGTRTLNLLTNGNAVADGRMRGQVARRGCSRSGSRATVAVFCCWHCLDVIDVATTSTIQRTRTTGTRTSPRAMPIMPATRRSPSRP
jgi:hypothetical protein